jgi:adenylate cyclase
VHKPIPLSLGFLFLLLVCWMQLTSVHTIRYWRTRLDYITYDIAVKTHLEKYSAKENPVAIVFIDDKSLKEQGRWPWPRAKLASLVEHLKQLGAVAVAFDIIFPEPEENSADQIIQALQNQHANPAAINTVQSLVPQFDNDKILSESLMSFDSILGMVFHSHPSAMQGVLPQPLSNLDIGSNKLVGVLTAESYSSNIPMIQAGAKTAGFINVAPDFDGVIRRVPLIINYKNALYPSLALAATKLYLLSDSKITWQQVGQRMDVHDVQLGKQIIPVDNKGQVLVKFVDPSSFVNYSATDVIKNKVPPAALAGKLVFLGVSAPGLGDSYSTSIKNILPGVSIHAAIASSIIKNNFSYVPNWAEGAELLIIIAIGLLLIIIFPFLSAQFLIITTLIAPILLFAANMYLFAKTGIVLSVILPMLLIVLLGLLNMAYGYFSEELRRKSLRAMFGQYVAPAYIEQLLHQPQAGLQSETKEMTVLFSDIRNFTTISEKMSAADIKTLLNRFFTPMTEIIFKHGGTIDKYVGDMIMAFWGAPLSDPDHAKHALAAALDMQAMAAKLKEEFVAQGLPAIEIGIGINTGQMSVGDMGSKFRRAYTVISDAVNLASRLENLTKEYHVGIIAGESTCSGQDSFTFKKLDEVHVKGKTMPVTVYELVGVIKNQ